MSAANTCNARTAAHVSLVNLTLETVRRHLENVHRLIIVSNKHINFVDQSQKIIEKRYMNKRALKQQQREIKRENICMWHARITIVFR